jgi:hypothetical protein
VDEVAQRAVLAFGLGKEAQGALLAMDPVSIWSISIAVGVAVGCIVAIALLTRHGLEPGTPEPEIPLDDTPVTDDPAALALIKCPHDVPINLYCGVCDAVNRGRHITLDGEPESEDTAVIAPEPRVPPPPPVSGSIKNGKPNGSGGAA